MPRPIPFALIVLAGLAVCALASLLPNGGPLTAVKLAIGTWGVLILPGAVILRLLGWPASPAAALPACAAWSVTALAPGFVLMLATGGGVPVIILWLLGVVGAGLLIGRGKPVAMDLRLTPTFFWFAAGVAGFAALMWIGSWNNVGDAVEHIARMRKITDLDPAAHHLDQLGLLPPDTGLHPGYAFPLWHATGAAIVWLTGLDETVMFRFWPTALIPFVAAAVYNAGRQMFGCRAAGLATCIGYLGAFAFPIGVGYFSQISYPGYICIFLFWPLIIDRTFTYMREGGREPIWTAAASSFVVSAAHPSYAPFMILLLGAFLVARFIMARDRTDDLRRLARDARRGHRPLPPLPHLALSGRRLLRLDGLEGGGALRIAREHERKPREHEGRLADEGRADRHRGARVHPDRRGRGPDPCGGVHRGHVRGRDPHPHRPVLLHAVRPRDVDLAGPALRSFISRSPSR